MKPRTNITVKRKGRYYDVKHPNNVLAGTAARTALRIMGYDPKKYKITNFPEIRKQIENELKRSGTREKAIKLLPWSTIFRQIVDENLERVICIEWTENGTDQFYMLAFNQYATAVSIWSLI